MVLEDANNSAPDSFSDNPYPSSNDPYASAIPPSGERFDATSLPQPLPIIGPFIGFSKGIVRLKVETTLKFAESKVGRTLHPDEAQALALHIYQLEQTKSYYAAAGLSGGAYRCWSTAADYRYPFYKPKLESINRNKFGLIRGPLASYARHAWRFTLYAMVAGQMGSIVGQLIAQPLAASRTAQDPKLEQFATELKAASQTDQQRTSQTGREIEQRRRQFEEQVKNRSGGGPSPQASWGRQPAAKREEPVDDMSPTAGNEAWGSQSPVAESWETFSNDTSQPAPQRQQRPPSTDNWNPWPQSNQQSQGSSPFDDDASPTGGLFQDDINSSQSQSQSQSRPGESTWDRLRRGGAPTPGQRPRSRRPEPDRREQREGSALGDSYTFVEGDGERKRAKEQAQQEFDARLERERQGRDFSNDDEKKW